mmetsp:Transcript_12910/g.38986  ORF Transcript_12910/g.38986 Transcript_12910/m.38986 type:complete len:246 (-) Transcript_12910:1518-2255(-)
MRRRPLSCGFAKRSRFPDVPNQYTKPPLSPFEVKLNDSISWPLTPLLAADPCSRGDDVAGALVPAMVGTAGGRLPPAKSCVFGACGAACSFFTSRGRATTLGANLLIEFKAPATRSFCFLSESRCFLSSSSCASSSSITFGSSFCATDSSRFSRSSATTASTLVSRRAQTFSVMRFAATPQYAIRTVRMSSTMDMDVTPWFAMYQRPRLVSTRSFSGCSLSCSCLRRRSSSSLLTTTALPGRCCC